jgi:hypothetical protein
VDAIQAEVLDKPVPFKFDMPEAGESITTARLVLFRGKRVLNAFRLQATAAPCAAAAAADGLQQTYSNAHDGAASGSAQAAAANEAPADAAQQDDSGGPPAPPVRNLVAIMRGQAPPKLTVREVVELAEACRYYMADSIVKMLPEYIAPVFDKAALVEVRMGYRWMRLTGHMYVPLIMATV